MHVAAGLPVLSPPSFAAVDRCCLTSFSGLQPPSTCTPWGTILPLGKSAYPCVSSVPSLPPHLRLGPNFSSLGLCKMRPKLTSCLYLHLALLPRPYPLSYSPIPTFFSLILVLASFLKVCSAIHPLTWDLQPLGSSQQPWERWLSSQHSGGPLLGQVPAVLHVASVPVPPSSYSVHIHPSSSPP